MRRLHLLSLLALLPIAACVAPAGDEDASQTEDDIKSCPGATVEGVDVSEWQGGIDWNAVKGSGRRFAMIRVSDGTFHVDPTFNANWAGAKAAGLKRGVYQFFRASEDGTAQANLLLQHMGALGAGDLPPVADVEVTDGVGAGTLNTHLQQWMERIKQATGKTPIIYTSPGLWSSLSGSTQFGGDTLWVANWGVSCPSLPTGWGDFKFWQYADDGHVPGISGDVDLDRFNGSMSDLDNYGGAPQGPPTAKPTAPTVCGLMQPGEGLEDQALSSCDGRFALAMQSDGNLVVYRGSSPLWNSGTNGTDGKALFMQTDGNLVVYGGVSDPVWDSHTNGHAGAWLAMQNDGNAVIYGPGGKALWASNTVVPAAPPAPSGCGAIKPGQGLTAGEELSSCNGVYTLAMQGDGNLVLYHNGKGALWDTHTNGKGGFNAIYQGDANFVLYNDKNVALWNSHTNGKSAGELAVQDDGNLVVYTAGGTPIWASGTNGK